MGISGLSLYQIGDLGIYKDYFNEVFEINEAEFPSVKFKKVTSDGSCEEFSLSRGVTASIEKSLDLVELWEERRDRHLNETVAVNFYRAEIGGDFHISCKSPQQKRGAMRPDVVSKTSFIAGKLNMLDSQIEGMLRLEGDPPSEMLNELENNIRFNLRQLLSQVLISNQKELSEISPVFSVNLCGSKVNAFSLGKQIHAYSHFSVDGFEYNRLVGQNFNEPEFGIQLMAKTCRNYSLEGRIVDISSSKRMLSYYESEGNHKCVEAFDAHLAAIQSLKPARFTSKLLSQFINMALILAFLLTVGSFMWTCHLSFRSYSDDMWMLYLSIFFFTSVIVAWGWRCRNTLKNANLYLSCRGEKENKLSNIIPFSRFDFYSRAFVKFGHGYIVRPCFMMLGAWLLMSLCFSVSPRKKSLVQGLEICLPPAGLITAKKEEALIRELVEISEKEEKEKKAKIQKKNIPLVEKRKEMEFIENQLKEESANRIAIVRYIVVLSKIIGWAMLSLIVAGYFKLLKTK